MALKTFKPYTKSTRGTVVVDKSSLWKGPSYKPLTKGQHVTGGRNNAGRITSRHMGGGSKHKFRIIDFFRKNSKMPIAGRSSNLSEDFNIFDLINEILSVVSLWFFLLSSNELIKLNPILPDSEELVVP